MANRLYTGPLLGHFFDFRGDSLVFGRVAQLYSHFFSDCPTTGIQVRQSTD